MNNTSFIEGLFYITFMLSISVTVLGLYQFHSKSYKRQYLKRKKAWLEESISHWRYPNGGHIPQYMRSSLLQELKTTEKELHKLCERYQY